MTAPAVVIPTWNGWAELERCLASLPPHVLSAVIVVDNGSVDGTCELLAAHFPAVRVVALPHNTGFAFAVNQGIAAAGDADVILLNNDTVVDRLWYDELTAAAAAAGPRVGFVQSKMVRLHDGRLDSTGDLQTWAGLPRQRGHGEPDRGQWDDEITIFSACGGASWFRREMLDEVGGFEDRFFAYYEDVDLCARARLQGWTGQFASRAVVRHAVSASSGRVQGFKRFQSTRNSWWLVVRTLPGPVLRHVLPAFLAMQALLLVQAIARREFLAAVRGHVAGWRGLPRALRDRRRLQAAAVVTPEEFAATLSPAHVRRELRRAVGVFVWKLLGTAPETWVEEGARHNADASLRYRAIVPLLPTAGRVLEVGSGSAGLAAYADVPGLVGLDADYAATSELRSGLVKVAGTGTALPFADGGFDATVSVDALEHVPPGDRRRFVEEMCRVTKPGGTVILACPVGRPASWADERIDARFRRRHARPHPWLAEHIEGGLPRHGEMLRLLNGLGTVRTRRNGWLPLWLWLQRETVARGDRVQRERFIGQIAGRAPWAPAYRRIYEIRR